MKTQSTTLFEKSNFCPKIQFWQNPNIFTSFSPKFFFTIFLVKSKMSTAKKSKTTTFSRVFHSKKSTIFTGNQSCIFGQKMKISNSVKMGIFYSEFVESSNENIGEIGTTGMCVLYLRNGFFQWHDILFWQVFANAFHQHAQIILKRRSNIVEQLSITIFSRVFVR